MGEATLKRVSGNTQGEKHQQKFRLPGDEPKKKGVKANRNEMATVGQTWGGSGGSCDMQKNVKHQKPKNGGGGGRRRAEE